jgi:predicted amidophosphoribosyltransferase
MWEEIKYIRLYNPYRGGRNPDFNKYGKFSEMILSLKKGEQMGINYLYKTIINNKNFNEAVKNKVDAIVVVPSHNPYKTNSGIKSLAKKIAQEYNWIDGTDCLQRIMFIQKLADGGNRNIDVHLKSIKLVNHTKIKDKCVLLIDDISSTGNSLEACKRILIENEILNGFTFAIGKTAHY